MRTISLLLVLLSLTFCQKEMLGDDIALAFPSDPPSLDPLLATDLVSQKLARFIYAGLYEFKNNNALPNLVRQDHYHITHKGPLLEMFLKSERGVNAEDVIFSLRRLKEENSPRKGEFDIIKDIYTKANGSIAILLTEGTREVEIKEKLALPFSAILVRKNFLASGSFLSFGPYELIEWKKNEYIKLNLKTKNSNNLPKTILIRILPQSTTSLFLYKKGLIDAFKLSDFMLTIPEADENHTVLKRGRSIQYIAINNKNKCFDKNFRYALNFAIPRELIISRLLEKKADLLIGPVPAPFYEDLFKKKGKSIFNYNLDLSRDFLKKSTCYPNILKTKIEFRMRADDENQAKGRALVQALKDIGLQVTLKGMEKAPLYKENGEGKGDLTLLTWYADFPSIWNFLDPLFHDKKLGNGGNRSHYVNQKISKALDAKKDMMSAQTLIEEIELDAPWIFLWSIQENYLVSDSFIRHAVLSDFL